MDGKLNDLHDNNWSKGRTDGELNKRHETNFSKNEELNGRHKNNLQMVEKLKKIALPRDGRQKNKSPKEGTDGGLYGWHEITFQIDGWHKNNSPSGWTDRES